MNYTFASAYIRSREKYLLTREKAEKMLDSKTPEDALKVLYELDYGDGSEEIAASEFETLLSRELEKTYNIILSLAPEDASFTVFLYPNDYHNIKVLLKAEFLGNTADEVLIGAGSVPLARMVDLVRGRGYSGMRQEMAKGIQEAIDAYGATRDPQIIGIILDKACYRDINKETAKIKNSFVKGYISLRIDIINLKSFIRAKAMNKPWDFFSKIYIEGGKIPERLFINGYDESPEQFADRLGVYNLQAALHDSAHMLKETGRFTALEKLCDNLLMDYARDAKYVSVGIEPLIGYMAAKESEIKTARIIMAGKLGGLSQELIKERMRDTYV